MLLPYYVFDLLLIMVTGFPLYAFFRMWYLRKKGNRVGKDLVYDEHHRVYRREIFLGFFTLFMMALLVFVLQGTYANPVATLNYVKERIQYGWGINMVPFHTICNYYRHFHFFSDEFFINVIGNVFLFIPWGFGIVFLWKKNRKWYRLVLFALALPCCIELTQLFIARQVDIDDIILNFLGAILGGLIYWIVAKWFPKMKEFGE